MKTLKLIPILIFSAGMFTACHKQDATTSTLTPVAASTKDYAYNSTITYSLKAQKTYGTDIFWWEGGYLHITNITYNPIFTNGVQNPGLSKSGERFGWQMDFTMNLFGPTVLSTAKIPAMKNEQANITLQLTPGGTTMAMQLWGKYNYTFDMPPYPLPLIQFTVNEPVDLNTEWLKNVTIPATGVTVMMDMDLRLLARGIDREMMSNATQTGSTIFISATQNPDIYKIMLTNLKSMMLGATLQANAVATQQAPTM